MNGSKIGKRLRAAWWCLLGRPVVFGARFYAFGIESQPVLIQNCAIPPDATAFWKPLRVLKDGKVGVDL